jgi:hypothetical protein
MQVSIAPCILSYDEELSEMHNKLKVESLLALPQLCAVGLKEKLCKHNGFSLHNGNLQGNL